MKRLYMIFALLAVVAINVACDDASFQKERATVNRQQDIYDKSQPLPVFDWSLEKHMLTQIYTARNKAVATYSYVQNQYTGRLEFECPSIGFPIPANTQLTNPHRMVGGGNPAVIDQPEPNGLYSSPSTRGTYVMCVNTDGKIEPVYEEKDVTAFVRPMKVVDGTLVPVEGSKPSLVINPKQ